MPWPPHPIDHLMGVRGAKGSFMVKMDTTTGKKKILQLHTHQEHPAKHLEQHVFKENMAFMIM